MFSKKKELTKLTILEAKEDGASICQALGRA